MPWVHSSHSNLYDVSMLPCREFVEWPTFGINDTAVVELEQETPSCVFDIDKIMNQQLDITVNVGGFIAVKTQSGRHDKCSLLRYPKFLYKDATQ
jgi:hypothetical protein